MTAVVSIDTSFSLCSLWNFIWFNLSLFSPYYPLYPSQATHLNFGDNSHSFYIWTKKKKYDKNINVHTLQPTLFLIKMVPPIPNRGGAKFTKILKKKTSQNFRVVKCIYLLKNVIVRRSVLDLLVLWPSWQRVFLWGRRGLHSRQVQFDGTQWSSAPLQTGKRSLWTRKRIRSAPKFFMLTYYLIPLGTGHDFGSRTGWRLWR